MHSQNIVPEPRWRQAQYYSVVTVDRNLISFSTLLDGSTWENISADLFEAKLEICVVDVSNPILTLEYL